MKNESYVDFYNLTVGELLNLYNDEKLVVNGFIFFPETSIRELKSAELQCLFDIGSFKEIVEKYPIEKLKEVRWEVQERFKEYSKKGVCVMYISNEWVTLVDGKTLHYIKRVNFDCAIRTITGSEIIV